MDRGLDEQRVRDRLCRLARLGARSRAPVTFTVTSLVAPSPPRTMPSASSRHTAVSPSTNVAVARLVDGDAARAVGEQHHAVVGRAFAVHGDRVERLVRPPRAARGRAAPAAPPHRSSRSRASSPSSARSCRSPSPCRRSTTSRPPMLIRAADFLRERVGRHDRARRRLVPDRRRARLNAAGSPPRILSIGRPTPITPVDATSTCSTGQPTSRAVSAAISRATRSPSSPVQALAQPLLTTIARAVPPERARCSRETTTGAAIARLVVKTAAACAGASETSSARSRLPLALMPALTPAARKPRGGRDAA